jgi:hypothetical protein
MRGEKNKLKTCPFCGTHPFWRVHAPGCFLGELIKSEWGSAYFFAEENAEAWNRRAGEKLPVLQDNNALKNDQSKS